MLSVNSILPFSPCPGITCVFSLDKTSFRGGCPVPLRLWLCWVPTRSSPSWGTTILICTAQIISVNLNWPRTRRKSWKRRLWSFIKHTGKEDLCTAAWNNGNNGAFWYFPHLCCCFWFPAAPILALSIRFSATENMGYLKKI